MPRSRLVPVLAALVLFPAAAAAQSIDWTLHADVDTLRALTTDEDGAARETTIWLLVLDGRAYIRTSDTRWGRNVERDPAIALRIGDEELPVRADFVTDEATRERVQRGFREKYGFMDRLTALMRSSNPHIMRLAPR